MIDSANSVLQGIVNQMEYTYDEPDPLLRLNQSGTFSWLGAPSGPGYSGVQIACGGTPPASEFTDIGTSTTCHADAGLLELDPYLTIRVLANGTFYDTTYRVSQL